MRVLLAGPYPLDPRYVGGGVEAAAFRLAEGLITCADVDLEVVSASKAVRVDGEDMVGGVLVHRFAEPSVRVVPNVFANVTRYRRAIEKLKPDIVHAQHPCAALGGIAAGYPTVFTIHGVIHLELRVARGWQNRMGMKLSERAVRKAASCVKHVIAVSQHAGSEYASATQATIHCIPNAIDDSFFDIQGEEVDGRMFYVGHVSARKNVLGMVGAFRMVKDRYPNAHLNIAGGTPTRGDVSYRKQVERRISESGLGDSVYLMGRVDEYMVREGYRTAATVCIFSGHESFSITLGQGMAAGKPVVATDCGGPSDLVEDGHNGYLVPCGDERAFAERSLALLADPDLRRSFGVRGRKVAEERFRKEVVAAQTLRVYEQALSISAPIGEREPPR